MATDKRFQILENVRDAFALILVASGYNFNIGHYGIGIKHYGEMPADKFPALMVAGADEKRDNVTNEHFNSLMDISIIGYVRSSDAHDPEVAEEDLSKLISDLTKALYVDHTRGGLCKFTEVSDIATDKGFIQPFATFEMIVQVEYRSAFSQP